MSWIYCQVCRKKINEGGIFDHSICLDIIQDNNLPRWSKIKYFWHCIFVPNLSNSLDLVALVTLNILFLSNVSIPNSEKLLEAVCVGIIGSRIFR